MDKSGGNCRVRDMTETTESVIIDSKLENVYAIAETYPVFVSFYKVKEIIAENQERMAVRISSSFYGKILSWEGEGTKDKNKSIDFVQTKGLLKGLRAYWIFEDLKNKKVKVTISAKLDSYSLWGRIFAKIIAVILIKKTTYRILQSLKKAAENNPWQ